MDIAGRGATWLGQEITSSRLLREAAGRPGQTGRRASRCAGAAGFSTVFRSARRVAPFIAPLGIAAHGNLEWFDLKRRESRHLLVAGGTPEGRAEVLRSVTLGLAMVTRPALLQILGIDFSRRELSILEALPHAAAETANDLATAQINLSWLAAELRARMEEGRRWPEMVLVVDDVDGLGRGETGRGRSAMSAILRSGGAWGIHLLGAAASPGGGLKAAGWSRPDVARITLGGPEETFEFSCGDEITLLTEIRVSAVELDRIARGWRPRTGVDPSGNDPREAAQGRDS